MGNYIYERNVSPQIMKGSYRQKRQEAQRFFWKKKWVLGTKHWASHKLSLSHRATCPAQKHPCLTLTLILTHFLNCLSVCLCILGCLWAMGWDSLCQLWQFCSYGQCAQLRVPPLKLEPVVTDMHWMPQRRLRTSRGQLLPAPLWEQERTAPPDPWPFCSVPLSLPRPRPALHQWTCLLQWGVALPLKS